MILQKHSFLSINIPRFLHNAKGDQKYMTDIEFEGKKVKKMAISKSGLNLTFRLFTEDGNQYSIGFALKNKSKRKKAK